MARVFLLLADSGPISKCPPHGDSGHFSSSRPRLNARCTKNRACNLHPALRLAIRRVSRYSKPVFPGKPDRPYFESWLKRTRKQLAASGRLSEIALILSWE